jgi:hypothetical protein
MVEPLGKILLGAASAPHASIDHVHILLIALSQRQKYYACINEAVASLQQQQPGLQHACTHSFELHS